MRRPGYLSNQRTLKPAVLRRKVSRPNPAGFGFFGKGMMLPPPEPGAIDAATGQPYIQDPNCPAGQKVVGTEPCVTTDPNDPCDPGEMDVVCGPDPNYKALKQVTGVRRLLPTGTGHYQEIANGVNVGPLYPATFPHHQPPANLLGPGFTCSADGTGGIRCEPAQTAPQPIFIPPPPPPPPQAADSAALQAELFQLESEALKADTMVVAPPMLAPPSAYTGGSVPTSLPTRQAAKEPTTSQKVMEIVQEYQTQREMEQPSNSVITKLPPVSQPRSPATAPSEEAIPGLLSWLKMSLFGDYPNPGLHGLPASSYLQLLIPATLAGALVVYLIKKA